MSDVAADADDIRFSHRCWLGHVTLSRPKAFNALTLDMCVRFGRQMAAWADDVLRPDCLFIGSSTGGPQALFKMFQGIGKISHLPVFVTQHMPATFTTILAEHLGQAAAMPWAEAKDGEAVVPGRIYVAPGDFHMVVEGSAGQRVVRLNKNPPENFCRPPVDPMLRSIAKAYGNKTLFVMLTGMGQDGLKGAQELINAGGTVIGQDEPSSVVWGMPGAVATAGLCSAVLPLAEIGPFVKKAISRSGT